MKNINRETKRAWHNMRYRCYNPKCASFPNYGGRNITVCNRWLDSFDNFLNDMGLRPDGMSLDRIDNNGNYEPGNCRWSTKKQQLNNTRKLRLLEYNGETLNASQWAERIGITPSAMLNRINKGIPPIPHNLQGSPDWFLIPFLLDKKAKMNTFAK